LPPEGWIGSADLANQVVRLVEFRGRAIPRCGAAFTITLRDTDGGTGGHRRAGGPRGVAMADHELGNRMALDQLAGLVEVPRSQPRP
jgi:hypothetical protein